jgi:RHS repeat-associated protein
VTNTVDAAGATTSTIWTGNSAVGSATNQMQGKTTNTYGANPGPNGNESLTMTQDPTGTMNLDSYGNGTGCQANNPTAATYLPATTTAPITGITKGCYDSFGNPMSTTDPAGNMTSVTYNPDGTPATATTPANQAGGIRTDFYESYGHQVYYAAPSNGVGPDHLIASGVWGEDIADENAASANYNLNSYDNMGRLTQVAYSGSPTNTVTYTYDADGNLTRQADNSGTTTSGFDGLGRVTSRGAPNGVNDVYSCDQASNLTGLVNASGTTGYHYNSLNEMDQLTEPSGRLDVLGYNAMGEQTDLWTNTGSTVAYSGTTIIPPASFATHTLTGYDRAGQITAKTTTLGSNNSNVFSNVTYRYVTDSNCGVTPNTITNQIRSEVDTIRNVTNVFCYDNAGRLSQALVNNAYTAYTYDADGNPTRQSLGTHTYNTADQNTDSGYSYDGDGNLTATPTMTASYNSADQTVSITPVGTTSTSFAYSGTGQATRSQENASGGATTFANGLIGLEAQTGTITGTTSFVYLPDGTPIEEATATGAYYYIADNQGSIIGLATTAGTPRASYTYTPYGAETAVSLNGSLPANPLGYTGGYTDPTTGLIHLGARYYNPAAGLFTQVDPTGRNQGYTYASDNPVNEADPSGTFSFSDLIPGSIQGKILSVGLGAIVSVAVDAIPGVGPVAGAIAGGCVSGAVSAALNHKSAQDIGLACAAGAGIAAIGGFIGQAFKNTVIPLVVAFVQKFLQ